MCTAKTLGTKSLCCAHFSRLLTTAKMVLCFAHFGRLLPKWLKWPILGILVKWSVNGPDKGQILEILAFLSKSCQKWRKSVILTFVCVAGASGRACKGQKWRFFAIWGKGQMGKRQNRRFWSNYRSRKFWNFGSNFSKMVARVGTIRPSRAQYRARGTGRKSPVLDGWFTRLR